MNESTEVGIVERGMDDAVDALLDGKQVDSDDKRWVKMKSLGGEPPRIGRKSLEVRGENTLELSKPPIEKKRGA